jgi:hypothetical protein
MCIFCLNNNSKLTVIDPLLFGSGKEMKDFHAICRPPEKR